MIPRLSSPVNRWRKRLCKLSLFIILMALVCVLVREGVCLWNSDMCAKREGQLIIDDRWTLPYHIRLRRHSIKELVPKRNFTSPSLNNNEVIDIVDYLPLDLLLPITEETKQTHTTDNNKTSTTNIITVTTKPPVKTTTYNSDLSDFTELTVEKKKLPTISKLNSNTVSSSLDNFDINMDPISTSSPPQTIMETSQVNRDTIALAIQKGEICKTVCPPFEWSEWSPCSKACGHGHRYRKAIYQFVCPTHSEKCPDHRLEEEVCDLPCHFDPEKYGGPVGLPLYPTNPLNPPIYPEDRKYMCGHWISEYTTLHKAILSGKKPPAYLIYTTGRGTYPSAGGLADRLKGITTVFFLAVLLDRALLIEWLDPPGLTNYLIPKHFDWTKLDVLDGLKRSPPHDIGSWRAAKEDGKSSQWYMNTNFSTFFTEPVEILQGNRYDYTFALIRNPALMPKAYELGIDRVRCRLCCTFDLLFSTNPTFQKSMNDILLQVGFPPKPYLTVHLRTKVNIVDEALSKAEEFLKCAQTAAKELHIPQPIILPIFNNRLVVHIMSRRYPDMVKDLVDTLTAKRTTHTHIGNLPHDTERDVQTSVQERTFKDFYLLLNSTVLVRTKGYIAALGNMADSIRHHYNPPGSIMTYIFSDSKCTKYIEGAKIE